MNDVLWIPTLSGPTVLIRGIWVKLAILSKLKQAPSAIIVNICVCQSLIKKKNSKGVGGKGICRNINAHILCILPPTALLPHAAQTRCFDEESANVFFRKKKSSVQSVEKEVFGSCEAKELKSCYDRIDCVGGLTVCVHFERNSLAGFKRNNIHDAIIVYCFYM